MTGLGVASPTGERRRAPAPATASPVPVRTASGPAPAAAHALTLQRTAGNRAVANLLVQRRATNKKSGNASAELLAMNVGWILDGHALTEELEALSATERSFLKSLSQAITGRAFGKKERLHPEARQIEWASAMTWAPLVMLQLLKHPAGMAVLPRLDKAMKLPASEIVRDVVLVRAAGAAKLSESLNAPKVKQARVRALQLLKASEAVYGKANMVVENAVGASGRIGAQAWMARSWEGLQTAQKLVTAVDPASYQALVKEVAAWQGEAPRAGWEVAAKVVEVEAQLIDMTVGTVQKATSLMATSITSILGKTGDFDNLMTDLKALQATNVRSVGSAALKIGKIAEKLATLGKVLNGIAVVGGVAKMVNAESTFDKMDAGADVLAGGLSLAGEIAGTATSLGTGLAAGGAAVGLTWGMVKIIGSEVAGAIEGSQYGGLWQELRELEAKAAAVVSSVAALDSSIAQRRGMGDALGATGADEASEELARKVGLAMLALDKRWQNSPIKVLQKFSPITLRQEILMAQHDAYTPEQTSATAHELIGELARAASKADVIVVDMLVEAGYFTKAKADKVKKKLAQS